MKLSNPTAIKSVALVISTALRAWTGLLDVRFGFDGDESNPVLPGRRKIFLFWHENIILPVALYSRFRVAALISRHRDGELIAHVVRMLRGVAIRGSTNRGRDKGGVGALREMLRHGRANHLALTPDGPKGPRREVQAGAIYLASRSAMPLVPMGMAFHDPWRAGSWDRMALPRPFSRAKWLFGTPIDVPGDLDRDGVEQHRAIVQKAMDAIQDRAQRAADGSPDDRDRHLLASRDALRWPQELTGS